MDSPNLKRPRRFPNFGRLPAIARLRRDERGVAAVEFALVAPAFFFLMFVIAEMAMVFIAEQVMDNAVFETARLIRTGQVQGTWSDSDFEDAVCDRMSVFVDCSGTFFLEVKSYDTFAELDLESPVEDDGSFEEPGGFDFGEPSSIIVVRAYYQWPTSTIPFTNLSLATPGMSGKRLIGSFAAFRNEPYTEE